MHANSYVGIVEQEVPRLVISRASRLRINADEIDDLLQQIVPKLAAFEYDPAKSNGATVTTAMTSVIDRQIKSFLRAKRRYQRRIERIREMRTPTTAQCIWPEYVTKSEPIELRMDLAAAMECLCERDQTICRSLSEGHTVKAIAEHLGCCRDTVSRAIVRIRQLFTQAGLRLWIDPDYTPSAEQA